MLIQTTAPAPFIKWVGGKRPLAPTIARLAPDPIPHYHEPFLGGGAIFFHLHDQFPSATLADAGPDLVNTYRTVRDNPGDLIEMLQDHAHNHRLDPGYYYHMRELHDLTNPTERASRMLYLSRTCFNGLYRVNRRGRFNVARGSYKNPQICDPPAIMAASLALRKADLRLADFSDADPGPGTFVYCDPPHHGTFDRYTQDGFGDNDHIRLRDAILNWHGQGALVMCSNADTPFVRQLYQDPPFSTQLVSAPRYIGAAASTRKQVPELLITTYDTGPAAPPHQPLQASLNLP